MEVRDLVRQHVEHLADGVPFSDDDDLVRAGIVDSLHVLGLVDFVAERFGVAVSAGDVARGSFSSVAAIERFVRGGGR